MYKRVVTKVTFVGDTFTRKPPKVCCGQHITSRPSCLLRQPSLALRWDMILTSYVSSSLGVSFFFFVLASTCCLSPVRALHQAGGAAHEEGARHTPRAAGDLSPRYYRRQEESAVAALHGAGRHHQGNLVCSFFALEVLDAMVGVLRDYFHQEQYPALAVASVGHFLPLIFLSTFPSKRIALPLFRSRRAPSSRSMSAISAS